MLTVLVISQSIRHEKMEEGLARRDLETCIDTPFVFTLFRKIHYHVGDVSVVVPLDEDDLPGELRDEIATRYPLAQVGVGRPAEPLVSVTLFTLRDQVILNK